MLKKIILSMVLLGTLTVSAHEGHDQAPGTMKSNHGGVVKAGKEINLEYVVSGTDVQLFPASHDGKDLNSADVQMTVTAKLPKGKAEVLKLQNKNGAMMATVDFKNAYRVEMNVEASHQGKKSTFKFQVEK